MKKKPQHIIRYWTLLLVGICALSGCIRNDIPFPTLLGEVTAFEVDGQVGVSTINASTRTIEVEVDETTDLSKVTINKISLKPEDHTSSSLEAGSVIDLTTKVELVLHTFQDYVWSVTGKQTVRREFTVENQVGEALFNEDESTALVYVVKGQSLTNITITGLKLGPEGSTITPDYETLHDFSRTVPVTVSFEGVERVWRLTVMRSTVDVVTGKANAWSKSADLTGTFPGGGSIQPAFEYQASGASEWTSVPAGDITVSGRSFSAKIKGLTPGGSYLFRAVLGNDKGSSVSFTTDAGKQLPNMSFDSWCKGTGSASLEKSWFANASLDAANYFWDSGNMGANTLGEKNPTSPEESHLAVAGAGKKAAKLASQKVLSVFAAGSIYSGQFGSVIGFGAELHFGRPYTERPARLKGFYDYTSGTINFAKKPHEGMMGKADIGTIYVLLTDWSNWFAVNTTTQTFIDIENDPGIIAAGILETDKTSGGYKEFTIDIVYRDAFRKPKYVVLVASASKYGDYFTGSTSSILYVDELTFDFD